MQDWDVCVPFACRSSPYHGKRSEQTGGTVCEGEGDSRREGPGILEEVAARMKGEDHRTPLPGEEVYGSRRWGGPEWRRTLPDGFLLEDLDRVFEVINPTTVRSTS
ncbi:MAG: hypothetical protein PSN37_00880 [Alphaproteobacteria bacterium]|nr:hypothetical protein [Alphaproteobacteria bacterium]